MPKGASVSRFKSRQLALSVILLVASLVLSGCTNGPRRVAVVDRAHGSGQPVKPVTSGYYVVQPGDTLYSIAFRFGRDWKELAGSNRIASPYTIKPKQRIYFARKAPVQQAKPTVAAAPKRSAVPAPTKPKVTPAPRTKPTQQASKPPAAKPAPPVAAGQAGKWQWPTTGTVISNFSSSTSLNKGIDIAGQLGQPIKATAKGTVVYAGSGLRGYGELVIIKHDETFISAYGHNRKILVNEGQQVNAGQQIAEMGSTGTDQVKLHFEIRRQGNPVDPIPYLPRR